MDRNYSSEMEKFEEMTDAIHDMDWHKAQTEAARNGQDAALKLAEAKAKEAAVHKATTKFWMHKFDDMEDSKHRWMAATILLVVVGLPTAYMIGAWIQ